MISSRGALQMENIFSDVAHSHVKNSRNPLFQERDVPKAWAAMCAILRGQMLMKHNVAISNKACSVTFTSKAIATDGQTKYCIRVPHFGFSPAYCTNFDFGRAIPREDATANIHRLPLEHMVNEAKLSAEAISCILREIFLYIGESVYHGRLVELELPGVVTVLLKQDRASVAFHEQLINDMCAIDSRKWPQQVKELAFEAIKPKASPRPSSASSRPRSSSSSRPTSARPASSSNASPPKPEHAFVSSAAGGRLFSEISAKPARPNSVAARKAAAEKLRKPIKGDARHNVKAMNPAAFRGEDYEGEQQFDDMIPPMAPTPRSQTHATPVALVDEQPVEIDGTEEESVYAVVSPQRHMDVASSSLAPSEAPLPSSRPLSSSHFVHHHVPVVEPIVEQQERQFILAPMEQEDREQHFPPGRRQNPSAVAHQEPASHFYVGAENARTPPSSADGRRGQYAQQRSTDVFFLDHENVEPEVHRGRKRFPQHDCNDGSGYHLRDLMRPPTPSSFAKKSLANRRVNNQHQPLHDNMAN